MKRRSDLFPGALVSVDSTTALTEGPGPATMGMAFSRVEKADVGIVISIVEVEQDDYVGPDARTFRETYVLFGTRVGWVSSSWLKRWLTP